MPVRIKFIYCPDPTGRVIRSHSLKPTCEIVPRRIGPDPTPLEKFRWDLCQNFLHFKTQHHMTQDDLADAIGVDKAKISKILHHRIDEFSTDRLIKLYQGLNPKVKIRVG